MNKKMSLIAIVSVMIMVIPMFAMLANPVKAAGQPPINTSTFWEGTIAWGPRRADPARLYDTGSGQLVFNSYETLVAPNGENYGDTKLVLASSFTRGLDSIIGCTSTDFDPATGVGTWNGGTHVSWGYADTDGSGVVNKGDTIYCEKTSDGTNYAYTVDSLTGTGPYTMSVHRILMVYGIRTSPVINFIDETGAIVDTMDADDVVYSLQRGMVMDQSGSPQWMFYKALFGQMNSGFGSGTVFTNRLAKLIGGAISKTGANEVTIALGQDFPEAAWNQTLGNTWGSILSKSFSISLIPNWNGDLYTLNATTGNPGWYEPYSVGGTGIRRIARSGYDTTGAYRYVGCGPYRVSTFSQATNQVIMTRNLGWWQGWPFGNNGNAFSTGYIDTYEIDFISDWSARKNAFLSGSIDVCAVPRANMFELLSNSTKEPDLSLSPYMKTIKGIIPALSMDANHFTFNIAPTSAYIGTGSFPGGIPTNFFNNTNVRKAFAYSFNITQYTDQTWFGEADYRKNIFVLGLVPDFYNQSVPGYDINYAAAEAALKAAVFPGGNVWTQGFTVTLLYNEGNDQRRIACEMTRAFFQTLSTFDSRVGPAFTINIATTDWATYLNLFEAEELPIFDIGWLADFADADNFVRPYMHSNGDFSYFQSYTTDNGWGASGKDALIDAASIETNNTKRAQLYQQVQMIYSNDVPSYPITIPQGRRWCQYWVKGWYFDALYPAAYIPSVYKYDDCWFDVAGAPPTASQGDGIVNMRDISYLILHFNARAPLPGTTPDPKWVGTYGNSGVDPYGDRKNNMRDISGAILHFNHKNGTLTP